MARDIICGTLYGFVTTLSIPLTGALGLGSYSFISYGIEHSESLTVAVGVTMGLAALIMPPFIIATANNAYECFKDMDPIERYHRDLRM